MQIFFNIFLIIFVSGLKSVRKIYVLFLYFGFFVGFFVGFLSLNFLLLIGF